MIKFAITGNIASGKSTVQKILLQLGYKVLDTDKVSHILLKDNNEIKKIFNNYDVFENNEISRTKLGKLVFSNKDLLNKLESIIHPLIKEEIIRFFEQNQNEKYVFVAIPLLYETNMQNLFDKVIFIATDDEKRITRLIKRNGYTKEYALQRINAQLPQTDKLTKADYIIYNNTTINDLKNEIKKIF